MTVNLEADNIFKIGHAHCYVVDPKKEGYSNSELKRYLKVEDIIYSYPKQEEGECIAILNVDEPRPEELEQIRWTVEGKEKEKYNGKDTILHNLKDEKVYEINFTSYIKDKREKASNAMLTYDEKEKMLTNLRLD
jgi:type VI secretion system secreted protein VgrG